MCGRFYIEPEDPVIRDFMIQINRSPLAAGFRERYGQQVPAEGEILPSSVVPVLALNRAGKQKVFPMRWGFSLKDASGKGSSRLIINARSETAREKPLFREPWARHRCAVPASWYYEWEHTTQPDGKKKTGQKYAIRPRDGAAFWLAGMYRMEEGLPSFTILTRAPSGDVSWMHDRMPLMLPGSMAGEWISQESDPEAVSREAILSLTCEKA